jgi:two-component system alkaline phosphatase synthesis response regulator PhoP
LRELLLRVAAVAVRKDGGVPGLELTGGRVRLGDAVVDFAAYSVERGGRREGLSRRELDLLKYLLANEGRAVDRNTLLNDVWGGEEYPTTRTVDMHVLKLRRKIEADPERPRHILTVHGVGYRFSRKGEG